MSNYFQAFDQLREEGWFIGEMIWNFADFKTAQSKYIIVSVMRSESTDRKYKKSSSFVKIFF